MRSVSNIALGLMLTMIGFFPAYADGSHGGGQTTAKEAHDADDQDTMKDFVLHAKQHIDDAVGGDDPSRLSVLYWEMRNEGIWKHEQVYLIALRLTAVVNHGKYTKSLYGNSLRGIQTVGALLSKVGESVGEPFCVQYGPSGSERWSCAVGYINATNDHSVLIGGFDHAEDDPGIVSLPCPDIVPEVTARHVSASLYVSESRSRETLKDFVQEAIETIKLVLALAGQDNEARSRAFAQAACLAKEPWRSGPTYLFIMSKLPEGPPVVVVNANNPELTGFPFENVLDEDGVDIGEEILKVAGEDGEGGFVEYKWDNPVINDDDVNEYGMSPGRSPKTSYVEAAAITLRLGEPPRVLIFGSGLYGTLEEDGGSEDDGGCAIGGTASNLGSAVFSLLLIVFSLCLGFWWKDRSRK